MLISPLAKKLCAVYRVDPAHLHGTGPHGRVMAADVAAHRAAPSPADAGAWRRLAPTPSMQPTREPKDGYYVYDDTVNMQSLARISLPIAVQCEKLLEKRYSLFDYIVRAMVKACIGEKEWGHDRVDVLLFEQQGEQVIALQDVADMSIYRIARECSKKPPVPGNYRPHIVICDAHTTRAQVAERLGGENRPVFALVVRGQTPKVGIRAGAAGTRNLVLPYTFYAAAQGGVSAEAANRIAAELQMLLFNPARLLLLR